MVKIVRKELLVGKRPTELLSVGPSFEEKPNDIVLVITGNPGLAGYYTDFMKTIFQGLKGSHAVWTISHAGHCHISKLPPQMDKDVFDLNDQLNHKIDFINGYVPKGARVTLIGHSIGCQIILNIIRTFEENADIEIKKSYLLFPTIERMKATPKGIKLWPVLKYFSWPTVFLTFLISLIPVKLKEMLIYWSLGKNTPQHAVKATVELINPKLMQNVIWMAYSELSEVLEVNSDILEKHKDKVTLYYGAKDEWCPLDYYHDLTTKVHGISAQICQEGFSHAFVLKDSVGMGDKVVKWMTS